jgi:hypothetical protein
MLIHLSETNSQFRYRIVNTWPGKQVYLMKRVCRIKESFPGFFFLYSGVLPMVRSFRERIFALSIYILIGRFNIDFVCIHESRFGLICHTTSDISV